MATRDRLVAALKDDGSLSIPDTRSLAEIDQNDLLAFQGGLERGRRFAERTVVVKSGREALQDIDWLSIICA